MSARWNGLRRLMHIATHRGVERDVDAELRFHVESRINDLVTRGRDPAIAREIAEREFGDLGESRRELIDVDQRRHRRGLRAAAWEAWWYDLSFSARALRRTPGVAVTIVVLLALGIGANTATFAVADELFLRPPAGVTDPDGLARLYLRSDATIGRILSIRPTLDFPAYADLAATLGSKAAWMAYTPPDSASVGIGPASRTLRVTYASSSYFPVLGARMAFGRPFTNDENRMGAGVPVAVVSYDVWRREFGGDSAVLGRQLDVALARYTIIGVAAPAFNGPDLDRTDIWLPIAMRPGNIDGTPWYRSWHTASPMRVIVRARAGVSSSSIATLATVAFRRGEREYAPASRDTAATILSGSLHEALGPAITPPPERAITSRLLGVTVMVLLIACANVANLLLLRGVRRRRETAIRLSLGISRGRLTRQLLIESTLLALIAAIAAIGVAAWGGALLRVMILPAAHWGTSVVTWRVVAVSIGVALITGVASGLAPAIRAGRTDLTVALKSGSREGGTQRSLLRATLVVTQAALSVVLLAGAGLFVRSLREVHGIDVGYDVDRFVYGTVLFRDPTDRSVAFFAGARSVELANGLASAAARLRAHPDVQAISLATAAPMGGYAMMTPSLRDGTPLPTLGNRDPALIAADPSYFAVTGVQLLRGRFFTTADVSSAATVVVINETAARTYWPGRQALGQCLILVPRRNRECATVIGVARDTHLSTIIEDPVIEFFVPIARPLISGLPSHPGWIVVRATAGHSDHVAAALRDELARQFPDGEPPYVTSAARAREPELRPWRLGATLFSLFGVLALLVASLGVYSTLAYAVGQRLHEMGVRIALGARRGQIVRLVLVHGMHALLVGVACGLALTVLLGRLVASMLYDTRPTDLVVLAAATLALLFTGLLGSLVPAWRAMRVDPVVSLRAE